MGEEQNMKDYSKQLASFAVFKKMYDDKKDILDMIAAFIMDVITKKPLYTFSIIEIKSELKNEFAFDIPEATLKTVLKKRLKLSLSNHNYIYDFQDKEYQENSSTTTDIQDELRKNNDLFIKSLFQFISEHNSKVDFTSEEKQKITEDFCSYVLEDKSTGYSDLISSFIIKNQNNHDFLARLNTIKAGVILYTGLVHTNLHSFERWDNNLFIFLDTEILLHCLGYHGMLYQELFNDFHKCVKEINERKKKKIIYLKYFKDTKQEIDRLFYVAEQILRKNQTIDPSKTAICEILKGCANPSDISIKKHNFYNSLKSMGVMEDQEDNYYSDSENYKYNLVHADNSEEDKDNHEPAKLLSYISMLRKNKNKNLKDIGFILLTGNGVTLKLSWETEFKGEQKIPKATSLEFLTNIFWVQLNKGLGEETRPKAFDILVKAQIKLFADKQNSVVKIFEESQQKYKDDPTKLTAIIATLRDTPQQPEDMTIENNEHVLSLISNNDIEQYIENSKKIEDEYKKATEQNEKLTKENKEKEKKLEEYKLKEEKKQLRINKWKARGKVVVSGIVFCIITFLLLVLMTKFELIHSLIISVFSSIVGSYIYDKHLKKKYNF